MQRRIVMNAEKRRGRSAIHGAVTGKQDLAKRSFFAKIKENCMATEARVLEESYRKGNAFGASFWSFFAKHSWG